jgi:hypothetical protein
MPESPVTVKHSFFMTYTTHHVFIYTHLFAWDYVPSLFRAHARAHTLTLTRSRSHAHAHTLTLTRSRSHAHADTHTLTLTLTRSRTLTLTRSRSSCLLLVCFRACPLFTFSVFSVCITLSIYFVQPSLLQDLNLQPSG